MGDSVDALMTKMIRIYSRLRLIPYLPGKDGLFTLSMRRVVGSLIITGSIQAFAVALLMSTVSFQRLTENPYYVIGFIRVNGNMVYVFATTTWFSFLNFKKTLNVVNACINLDKKFPPTAEETVTVRKSFIFHVTFFGVSTLTAILVFCAKYFSPVSWWSWAALIPILFVAMAPDTKIFHFVSTITALAYKMTTIKKRLDEIPQLSWKKSEHLQKAMSFASAWTEYGPKRDAENVRFLRSVFNDIYYIKSSINDTHGIVLLAQVTGVFFESVFFVFWNLTILQMAGTSATEATKWQYTKICGYTIIQITKLIIVTSACYKWKKAADVSHAIHSAINRVQGQDTLKELLLFSADLRHRDPNITASGFCDIHFGLLREMVGSVSMYIIILMQFKFPVDLEKMDPVFDLIHFSDVAIAE